MKKKLKNVFIFKANKILIYKVYKKLLNFNKIIKERKIKENIYLKNLDKTKLIFSNPIDGSVPWRFTFLVKKNRNKLVNHLRKKNYDISTWYPPVHMIYSNQSNSIFKNSNTLKNRVINLWLDEKTSKVKVYNLIKEFNNFYKK